MPHQSAARHKEINERSQHLRQLWNEAEEAAEQWCKQLQAREENQDREEDPDSFAYRDTVQELCDMDELAHAKTLLGKLKLSDTDLKKLKLSKNKFLWKQIESETLKQREKKQPQSVTNEYQMTTAAVHGFIDLIFDNMKKPAWRESDPTRHFMWKQTYRAQASILLKCKNVYSISTCSDIVRAKDFLRTETKLRRLPSSFTLQVRSPHSLFSATSHRRQLRHFLCV